MGKIRELKIDDFIYPNIGVGTYKDQEVRVKGGLPGRKVAVRMSKRKKDYLLAKHYEDLEFGSLDKVKGCGNLDCGGCSFQTFTYEDERATKLRGLENLAKDKGLDLSFDFHDNPQREGYRGKMEYTFGDQTKGGDLYLGLHKKKAYYDIVETPNCKICHPDFEKIRSAVQAYFRSEGKERYRKSDHKGFLRNLVIRYSISKGQLLVMLVTSSQDQVDKEAFVRLILGLDLDNEVKSIIYNINDDMADAVKPGRLEVLYGSDHISERVLGLDFKITAFSFFQPNVRGIERLYSYILDLVKDMEVESALDLYSGTGTIGQIISKEAERVIAIEIVEEAVQAAKENARANGITNVDFIAGDVLAEIDKVKGPVDLIVLDPPRSGINKKALAKILSYRPKNFIYISCNPRSMMEDLPVFYQMDYSLEGRVQVFDQFTGTYHLETVALMSRK